MSPQTAALAAELEAVIKGGLIEGAPLKEHTTFGIGGPVELMLLAKCVKDVQEAMRRAARLGVPVVIMGGGSNLLAADEGLPGLAIKFGRGFSRIKVEGTCIAAQAGALLEDLCESAACHGLGGVEFLVGIPGTVGGAVAMNAGAFEQSIAPRLDWVEGVDQQGRLHRWYARDLAFRYRESPFLAGDCALVEAELALVSRGPDAVRAAMQQHREKRRLSMPASGMCAGSVFRNPVPERAGRLIDAAGCKGMRVGNAQVSPEHANVIVNLGEATCNDVLALIRAVRDKVEATFGVRLEPEVVVRGATL